MTNRLLPPSGVTLGINRSGRMIALDEARKEQEAIPDSKGPVSVLPVSKFDPLALFQGEETRRFAPLRRLGEQGTKNGPAFVLHRSPTSRLTRFVT